MRDYTALYVKFFPLVVILVVTIEQLLWALIIGIIIFKLFEPPSYDFHLYNDLEDDNRQ